MGRVYEKWHICKCLVFHAENLVKVYTQKNSGYTKSRRKIRQQKIPKINSKFLHIEVLSREAWASKDTRFLTLSPLDKSFPKCFPKYVSLYVVHPLCWNDDARSFAVQCTYCFASLRTPNTDPCKCMLKSEIQQT